MNTITRPLTSDEGPVLQNSELNKTNHIDIHRLIRPELSIVIPCFNEKPNVRPMVDLLEAALPGIAWEAVFVDDDSPDGTANEVRELAEERDNVRVLHRLDRRGLSGACIEGILSCTSPLAAVIDADLQHDETKLKEMFLRMRNDESLDLVIGSRHVEGGSATGGLSAIRAAGSNFATTIAKKTLKISASDPMSGFFMIRRLKFNTIVTELQPQGFKILADILSTSKGRWNIDEIGYEFRTRQFGESKMDAAITMQFLGLVASKLTGGFLPIRFILFAVVGVSGILVQLAAVKAALTFAALPFFVAQSFAVAVAMTTNYTFNNLLTYRDRQLTGLDWWKGLVSFYAICFLGAVANVSIAEWVNVLASNWALASVAGAIFGALWNFLASAAFTWKVR